MKQFFASVCVRMTVLMLFSLSIQQIAQAQVRVPFKQRTSAFSPTKTIYSINGDYTMIGNTNLTLQNYSDTRLNSNNTMIKVDADGISGTNNSSASTLTFSTENGAVPSCSKILYAGLYWTARTDNNVTETAKRTVKFRGPNQAAYTTYTALSNEIRYPGDDNMYVAFTEVTSQVQQCGLGQYWVADMALTTGDGGNTGYYGGWGMVVVYENSKMVKRDITVFDGYAYVIGGAAQWELPVSGFNSTLSGNVNMKLGMIAGEGDVTIAGDKFEIQKLNTSSWQLLNHTANSSDNFFNSSIFTGGNARNPELKNNTGVDISMFSIPNANNQTIGNGQSNTKFRYSSTQDTYIIYSICMAVDAYEPGVEGFLTTESVNQVPVTGSSITVLPGDQVKYKVQIKNTGNESINNAQLKIPLPYAAIKYIGSTVQVFSPATSTSQPFVDLGMGANGTLVWNIGTLPKPANPNTVLGEIVFTLKVSEDCDLYKNFKCAAPSVEIDGTISGTGGNTGISVNDQPFYVGFSNTNGCTTEPLTGPFKININATDWTNTNCQNQSEIRDFAFCNRTTPIQITEVLGFYPVGTRFFNTAQTIEYTTSNPFPSVAGPTTYYAQLPNSSCVLSFRIAVNTISSVPTVMPGTSEFCQNGTSTILQATPSNPSYSLYYYAPGNPAIQPFILPATDVAGDFVYQVAEGPSSTCISINRANLPVKILPQPSISAAANQIACFGATGSVSLSSSGGTGTLTYSSSNPSSTNLNAGSYTYEVSDSKGCKNTASALINPAPAQPQQPVIACWQSATWNAANCEWVVTGSQPAEPTNLSCWQSANFNTESCQWVVTGSQPAEPTNLACWQSANFNTESCQWVVTGTQPAEPTNLACWQSANFNTESCQWVVTGTQPAEPTNLSCWQSANFNTESCQWVVTGTQPAEPTNLACWQSANFNTESCQWVVTGSQPAEPTNLSCWQSANFNTSTCEWVVSGTQPAEPTNLSCWQSANFNTSTCEWVVSGTQPAEPTGLFCWQSANFNTSTCEWDVTGNNPAAITSVTGLSPLCVGGNANYSANGVVLGGGSGIWSSSNSTVASVNTATGAVSALSAGTTNIVYTITAPCGTGSGRTWETRNSSSNLNWQSVAYNGSTFVAVGRPSTGITDAVMTSTDGDNWTSIPHGLGPRNFNDVIYANNMFVAVSSDVQTSGGTRGAAMYSVNGDTWTLATAPRGDWQSVAYGNGTFVAVASSTSTTKVMSSTDGINWTSRTPSSTSNIWRGVTFGNGLFVAVSTSSPSGNANIMTSSNGINWTAVTPPGNTAAWAVAFGNEKFVAVSQSGAVMTSTDGSSWTLQTSAASIAWNDVTFADGLFVAVASSGTGNRIMTSADGIRWVSEASAADNIWNGITYGNGKFVVVGETGTGNRVMVSAAATGTITVSAQQTLTVNSVPAEPTNLACWQSANFNTETCQWVVSGTQPTQPTDLACWQTANFNTESCQWVVTGTQPAGNFVNPNAIPTVTTDLFSVSPSVEARARWGASGFEAVLFTPANPGPPPNGVGLNLDPSGAPVWGDGTTRNFKFTHNASTGTSTWSIDWNNNLTFGTGEVVSSTSSALVNKGFNYVNIFLQGANVNAPATGASVTVQNLSINGANFGTFSANNSTVVSQNIKNSSGVFGDITATGSISFVNGLGTLQERPRFWIQLGQPVLLQTQNCWDNYVFNNETCQWENIGTQPTQPTNLACWQTATFNTESCSWVVTGSQPAEPTNLACWQSANFNTANCEWIVTGSQPAEPTNLACWQSANFNTESCQWVVTGTQPAEPTNLACWQSANFNTESCQWVVTGTQPTEPTGLSCWQSANFNTSTCEWVVSGNQPSAPTGLSCWQLANFNTSTCEWVVTGNQPVKPTAQNCWDNFVFQTSSCSWVNTGSPSPLQTTTASACGSYLWTVSNQTYTNSGTFNFSANCQDYQLVLTIQAGLSVAQISGPGNSCAFTGTGGNLATYSVSATNATGYNWTIPTGATSLSGQGTSSISFRFPSTFNSGSVAVSVSGCGGPILRSISVSKTAPICPAAISGPVNVCAFRGTTTAATYSVSAVANATSYIWTLPSGISIKSGAGTSSIQVLIASSFCGGNISVVAASPCGNSSARSLSLNVSIPATPATITGTASACPGNVYTYSVAAVANATSYHWTVPAGSTIVSGTGTNSISLSFGNGFTASGNLSVRAVNGCGSSAARSLSITRNAVATPSVISGQTSGVCGLSSVTYTVTAVAGITYNWTVPSNITILSGQGTASLSIRINSGFTTGNLSVTASNGCGSSTARTLCITSIAAEPASITGPASVLAGSAQTYRTSAVSGAVSYTWAVPSGWTIQSGQGTATITVRAGTKGGSITVRSVNSCGSSSIRSLTVSVGICARLAVEEESEQVIPEISLNAYPNPFSDGGIRVVFSGMEERLILVEIMDVHGREVLRREFKTASEIHLQPEVPAGIYTLRISDANEVLKVFRIQRTR